MMSFWVSKRFCFLFHLHLPTVAVVKKLIRKGSPSFFKVGGRRNEPFRRAVTTRKLVYVKQIEKRG